jgi:hypothetical protein
MTRAALLLRLTAVAALVLQAVPAFAADPVFPKGGRVGLVPIEGLVPASGFPGFQATDQRVKVVVTELPKEAFASVEQAFKTEPATSSRPKLQALELQSGMKAYYTRETATDEGAAVRRFSLIVAGPRFSGYVAVQVPDPPAGAFSDEAVTRMLATVAMRNEVPPAEQLDLLPFKISELGGFKTMRLLPGAGTVLLTDAADEEGLDNAPYMLIGLIQSGPATPEDRGRFAEQAARALPGLRDIKLTMSEPLRIDGTPAFETRLEAVTGKDNTPVVVVQWLRFGTGNTTMRIVAGARKPDWSAAFPRFRSVRDGIGPR